MEVLYVAGWLQTNMREFVLIRYRGVHRSFIMQATQEGRIADPDLVHSVDHAPGRR